MADVVKVSEVSINGEDKKGNPVFEATGLVGERGFVARSIQWNGEPIFKLQEGGAHKKMSDSEFTRGDRIAVARACKAARLEKFGNGAKARIEPELDAGTMVAVAASVEADANTASQEELEAAEEIVSGLTDDQQALLGKIAELDQAAA